MTTKTSLFVVTFFAAASLTHAALVIDISQVGPDVVAIGSGSVNLAGMSHANSGTPVGVSSTFLGIDPSQALISIGGSASFDPYSSGTDNGPANLGLGMIMVNPDSSTGDFFGNAGTFVGYDLWLPAGYVSGNPLSGSSTWLGTTIGALGLTSGTYNYTFGADSLTVNVGVAVVPEASSIVMTATGAMALGTLVYRRRKAKTKTVEQAC